VVENKDNPPTLASLRTRRGAARSSKRIAPADPPADQAGLLFESAFESAEGAGLSNFEPAVEMPRRRSGSPSEGIARVEAEVYEATVFRGSAAATERRIWSVRDLIATIRRQLETSYTDLWIEGEISNCRAAGSGHMYFTLKDGEAQLPVVLFRRQAALLRFRPADGLAVLVRGRISIYDSRGQLQLIAETMEPRGTGALQLAFEQLKARLLAEGLFDVGRKRSLPAFPKRVGVITSPGGAVLRDIVTVARRRHGRVNLLVYPATMQGTSCCTTVAAGIRWFNANPGLVDIIIVARGGGSMEDLAGFNDEALARTIAESEIPVVSAIGHETDFTIADFVADLRAPTPSAAAELVTAAQHRIEERVQSLVARVERAGRFHLIDARQRYARLSSEVVLVRLSDAINRRDQRIDELRLRVEVAAQRRLRNRAQRLDGLIERLRRQDMSLRIATAQRRLQSANDRLHRRAAQVVASRESRLHRSVARLEALSPVAVLSRGYALVYAEDGTLLRSAADIAAGRKIHARLGEGSLDAQVIATKTTEKGNT